MKAAIALLAVLCLLALAPPARAQQPAPAAPPQVFPKEYALTLTPDQINALYEEIDKSTGSHVDIERMKALIRGQVIAQNEAAAKAAKDAAAAATPPKP